MRSWVIGACGVMCVAVAPASGQDDDADDNEPGTADHPTHAGASGIRIVGLAGGDLDGAWLVASDGRGFVRSADGTGYLPGASARIATTLTAARPASTGEVWALGDSPPAYRWDGATWQAEPVRRKGTARLSTGGALAMSAGRRVFVRVGNKWKEIGRVRGQELPVALWAASATDALALLPSGTLLRLEGRVWKPIANTSAVRLLAGAHGPAFALLADGGLARIDKSGVVPLRTEANVSAFVPALAVSQDAKSVLFVGEARVDDQPAVVILKASGKKLLLVDRFPDAAIGLELVGSLAAADGSLLTVSRDGVVYRRDAAGGWSRMSVVLETPATTTSAGSGPARVGP